MKCRKIFVLMMICACMGNYARAEEEFTCPTREIQRWKGNGFDIVVCSYGTPPMEFKKGWWRGCGLTFYKVSSKEKSEEGIQLKDHSEALPDMDYSFDNGNLIFILYTYDPRENDIVPFVKEQINLETSKIESKFSLLLGKPEENNDRVEALFRLLSATRDAYLAEYTKDIDANAYDPILMALYELRNYGLNSPGAIRERLSRFSKTAWWYDGYMAEELNQILDELAIVQKCRYEKRREGIGP